MSRIIYIMGTARSGTTIIEILLANNPGIFGTGEITHLFLDGFLGNARCACGEVFSNCDVWSAVRRSFADQQSEIAAYENLLRSVEWHSRFPKLALNRIDSKVLQQYGDLNVKLLQSVFAATSARVLVDSSKYAGRALALSRTFGDRLSVICLTRSPAGIMAAFQKKDAAEQKSKSTISAMVYYLYVMSCLRYVKMKMSKRVLALQYEDLRADPDGTLSKIEHWSNLDLTSARQKLAHDDWFDAGHIVIGNRLRRKGRIKFMPDARGAGRTRFPDQLAVSIMGLYRRVLCM